MTYQDTSPRVLGPLSAATRAEYIRAHYRPMRGQAYVRLDDPAPSLLFTPKQDPHKDVLHKGTVLDLGEPARIGEYEGAPECPWDIRVGDVVWFNLFAWLDKMRTLEFFGVEGEVMVVAQAEIVAVEGVNERVTERELAVGEEECDG